VPETSGGVSVEAISASIVIPTFNGASRIGNCLDSLVKQTAGRNIEILVVDDGSTDSTPSVVGAYSSVRLISQENAGPASARNRGALESHGRILLFTDDDCVPMPDWIDAMLSPFSDPDIVGAKGVYRTNQRSLAARFVQVEYEDKYRLMARLSNIDFIDTYSAAFRRDRFLEMTGYDTSFPVACAEDVELSYRMSARGWKMKFVPSAIVYHTHPDKLPLYLKKKYKFAFWRVLAVRKNPSKGLRDSHTPQLMKIQLLFPLALLLSAIFDLAVRLKVPASTLVLVGFFLTTVPFALRAIRKDVIVGILSPILLAARSCAQLLGITSGLMYARRKPAQGTVNSRPTPDCGS
jgi:GT2 family glycosyltransferase